MLDRNQINRKKNYVSPQIRIAVIEMEESIAVGSATVLPIGNNGDYSVDEKWTDDNISKDVSW